LRASSFAISVLSLRVRVSSQGAPPAGLALGIPYAPRQVSAANILTVSAIDAFVYLLRCADGSLYCGWSTDPERRLREHQRGVASRYTRTRRPVELVWTHAFATRSEAMREEVRIKRLPARQKRALLD
jgi:putative endonuclease